jgi:hypothetical protein
MDPSSVQADLDTGSASYRATNLSLLDFGTLANAILNAAPQTPATASFRVQWQLLGAPGGQQIKVRDAEQGYAGTFWQSTQAGAAFLEWSAAEAGFAFVSDGAASSSSYFAQLGHERNGVFFPQGA